MCKVEIRQDWPVNRWLRAIRRGEIRIQAHMVILYLEGTRAWQDVIPLKNTLQALCKAIRTHAGDPRTGDPRIFISNHIPFVSGSPVHTPLVVSNFTLQQATRGVCQAMGRVFKLSMYEHFVSQSGRSLKPSQKYFQVDALSHLGCLVFRECLLREAGLKRYWFGKRPRTQ